ncbi:hypothetical protein E8E14_012448 [Neopestalotiopsis sp. 37M]|nr:hypothetical protein E8E14_012448 [Neopestalotiopsis sp. 37M]
MDTRYWIMSCYSTGENRYNFVDDFHSVMTRALSGGAHIRDGMKDMIDRLWRGRNHMWPNGWVQCLRCNEDWTVDPRRKNLRYNQQDLNVHLNSFFHTPLAQWLRGQDWVIRNSGRGWVAGVMCPYCFQMGTTCWLGEGTGIYLFHTVGATLTGTDARNIHQDMVQPLCFKSTVTSHQA